MPALKDRQLCPETVVSSLCAAVFCLGVLVMLGWVLDIGVLKSIHPDWVTMKFSTALSFALSGAIVYLIAQSLKGNRSLAQSLLPVLTLILLMLMSTILVAMFFQIRTGVEDLFIREPAGALLSPEPGRPSIGTIIAFMSIALAGLITMLEPSALRRWLFAFAVIILLISATALLGYAISSPALYFFYGDFSSAMAFHTALLFLILGGLLLYTISKLHPVPSAGNDSGQATNNQMSISSRLSILFVFIVLIPLVFVTFLSMESNRSDIREILITKFEKLAIGAASQIELMLQERIIEAERLASLPQVREALRNANSAYENMAKDDIITRIHQLDTEWIEAGRKTPTADRVLNNELSDFLLTYAEKDRNRYGEIFVTDRHSATVAMTKRLSDYYQADEDWWEQSFDAGRGKLFLDDRGFDESIDAIVIGVVVPVRDQDEVIGILKINFRVDTLIALPLAEILPPGAVTMLIRSSGFVIAHSDESSQHDLRDLEKELMQRNESGYFETKRFDSSWLVAFSPVELDIFSRVPQAGERKGISGERWERSTWFVFLESESKVYFQALADSRLLALTILVVALVAAGIVGVSTARGISRPILSLRKGTQKLTAGNLGYQIPVETNDEIGQLAADFNQMTARLEKTLATRDELIREVDLRTEAEERLNQLMIEMERSNKELQQFAYVASHDLQEPLRMVVSFLSLVKTEYADKLDDNGREYIDYAVDGGNRMKGLIKGLLEYSRVQTQGREFELVNSGTLLADALVSLDLAISESNAEVTYDELPYIYADPGQFTRLFLNLINNALKFRSDLDPVIHISCIRAEDVNDPAIDIPKGSWLFSVKDNGIGFENEEQEQIFQMYQRLNTQTRYPGTGIGLALCKRIVERHGGKIWADSKPGQGACFYFTIPEML